MVKEPRREVVACQCVVSEVKPTSGVYVNDLPSDPTNATPKDIAVPEIGASDLTNCTATSLEFEDFTKTTTHEPTADLLKKNEERQLEERRLSQAAAARRKAASDHRAASRKAQRELAAAQAADDDALGQLSRNANAKVKILLDG